MAFPLFLKNKLLIFLVNVNSNFFFKRHLTFTEWIKHRITMRHFARQRKS